MPPPKIWRLYIYEDYSQPRIHKSSLMSAACSRSAYHQMATGLQTSRLVRVAPVLFSNRSRATTQVWVIGAAFG
jgi:hypothetical protein